MSVDQLRTKLWETKAGTGDLKSRINIFFSSIVVFTELITPNPKFPQIYFSHCSVSNACHKLGFKHYTTTTK